MGEVWTCRDRELRREVAVKFLALDDAVPPDVPQRFEREAVAAAQLCVLGPLTEEQHAELVAAPVRHAGDRWRPEIGYLNG